MGCQSGQPGGRGPTGDGAEAPRRGWGTTAKADLEDSKTHFGGRRCKQAGRRDGRGGAPLTARQERGAAGGNRGSGPDPGLWPAVPRLGLTREGKGASRTVCLAQAARALPDCLCFVLTSSPLGMPAQEGHHIHLFPGAPNSQSPESTGGRGSCLTPVPGAGPPPPLPHATDVEGQPGASVGPPGQSLHGRPTCGRRLPRTRDGRWQLWLGESSPRQTLTKGPPSRQAQATLRDAAGALWGKGLPRDRRSRAIWRGPAHPAGDKSVCTLGPGSHFAPRALHHIHQGAGGEGCRRLPPAAWRFWTACAARREFQRMLPGGSEKLQTRVGRQQPALGELVALHQLVAEGRPAEATGHWGTRPRLQLQGSAKGEQGTPLDSIGLLCQCGPQSTASDTPP